MRNRTLLAAAALIAAAITARGSVTVQGWWHLDATQPITDSSGFNRTFGSAFSTSPNAGGQFAAQAVVNGAGGPLDGTGYSSTQCILVGVGVTGKRQSAMWGISYNPPATNYGIEIWVLPQDNGIAGGSGGWILSSGQGGGVAFRINAPGGGNPSYIDAFILGSGLTIGSQVPIDTNRWMHLALVNAGGITTFYTNGIPCGPSDTNNATVPSGDVYCGTPSDNQAYYGYLDEARMFTFAPGAFSTNDLLLRPPGPNIIQPPQSASVWNGGAAPFSVIASFDNSLSYQWRRSGTNIPGATLANYFLPQVASADSGSPFACVLTANSLSVTSATATLTVVTPNAANVNAYRTVVLADSPAAFFPVDNCTGTTLTNVIDANYNGTLELNATYDGRTNRAFGQRALSFNADGDVTIPNNTIYDFTGGNGTVEALVYVDHATVNDQAIFAMGLNYLSPRYELEVNAGGNTLRLKNGTDTLSWTVASLIGRQVHVAFVFDHDTNVTVYVNGVSQGTQQQTAFGPNTGGTGTIGSTGSGSTELFAGTIDELAVYGTALSGSSIQTHYTKLYYGTNVAPPLVVSQSLGPKTLLAGASPILSVTASGALPIAYQWTSNGVPISGANAGTFTLAHSTINSSANYAVVLTNVFGSVTSTPIALTFVAPPAGYVSTVMNDGPSSFWRLAESAGPTAVDSAGLNDGTYNGGIVFNAGGMPGDTASGVHFNGSSGVVLVPVSPTLNPSTPFTVEFFTRMDVYGFYSHVSSLNRTSRDSGWEFYVDGNYPGFEFHTSPGGYSMITGDNTAPAVNVWMHVVGVYANEGGTNFLRLYVNGQHAAPNFEDSWPPDGPYVPNQVKPLYIGARSDNTHYVNGTMGDVAFYNYALNESQISNHWRFLWVASSITQNPAGVTNVEGSTVTLSPQVAGYPNTYQWFKGATPLTATANFDGTPHYPQDVTNLNLVIAEAQPADSGQYHLVVSNPLGGSTSGNATILITPDTNAPAANSAAGLATPNASGPTPYLVRILFNKRVDPATAGLPGNYVFSPAATVSSVYVPSSPAAAAFGGDWKTAFLQTAGLTPGVKYSVTVSGVKDQAQTPNTMSPATLWFRAPLLTAGALDWDYYYPVSGGVAGLLALPNYGIGPETNGTTTIFDSTQITGGDLNNQGYGAYGDNYGSSLSGWITPTVSGNYTFFLASDDSSELLLSTDSNPANAAVICTETSCCHGFQEPPAPTTSTPITLSAGTPYFIQALQTEGGGGDYVKVAWRLSTDTTASTNLPPIQTQYLSSYAPVPAPKFTSTTLNGTTLTINWSGYQATLLQSSNLVTWTPVPGNPNPLVINVTSAPRKFYRLQQ
jgi:hypothetical protein